MFSKCFVQKFIQYYDFINTLANKVPKVEGVKLREKRALLARNLLQTVSIKTLPNVSFQRATQCTVCLNYKHNNNNKFLFKKKKQLHFSCPRLAKAILGGQIKEKVHGENCN